MLGIQVMTAQPSTCSYTLTGIVYDTDSKLVVPQAAVFLVGNPKGTYTDSLGNYKLTGLCAGTYTLICRHVNHEEKSIVITLKANQQTQHLYLSCHTHTLKELHIHTLSSVKKLPKEVNTLHTEDIYQGDALAKLMERMNGVYTLGTGNGIQKPVLRGMHSNRVLLLNNGVRQEGQQWGNEHAPEIDAFLIQDVEIVKGPQALRYGNDGVGGTILLKQQPLADIEKSSLLLFQSFSSNGRRFTTGVRGEGFLGNQHQLQYRLQGSGKRAGNNRTPDYFLKNTGLQELSLAGAMGYSGKRWKVEAGVKQFETEIGIFSGSHIGNLTDLYASFQRETPADSSGFSYTIQFPKQVVSHTLIDVQAERKLDSVLTTSIRYSYQSNRRKEFDKNLLLKTPEGEYKPVLSFLLNTHSVEWLVKHNEWKHFQGSAGINGLYQINNYFGNYLIPNYTRVQGGFFLIEKWHRHAWSVEAGLRYDWNNFQIYKWENNQLITPTHRHQGLAGQVGIQYAHPWYTLNWNLGTTWRAPFVNERYSFGVHQSAASFEIGNRNLLPERSWFNEWSVQIPGKKKWSMMYSVFVNYMHRYINLQPVLPATLTIRGAYPTWRYNQGHTIFTGLEAAWQYRFTRSFQSTAKASYLYVRDVEHARFLVGMPPARCSMGYEWKLRKTTTQSVVWDAQGVYTFEQHQAPAEGDYVPPPSGYALVNSSITLKQEIHRKQIRIQLGVQNALNTRYRDYLSRYRYFANEPGRNIFLSGSIQF
jgi:iron complex outermembrane receptor protein